MSSSSHSFLPYGRHTITESDINAVCEVLRSANLTQGPVVNAFEQACSKALTTGPWVRFALRRTSQTALISDSVMV